MLLFDYNNLNDSDKAETLLNSIEEKARPASLMKAYVDVKSLKPKHKDNNRKWHSMQFYNENDSLESFMPIRSKMNVLYFSDKDDEQRKEIISELDSLFYNYLRNPKGKKQLQIADIMLDNDTSSWKRTLRSEKTDWEHFWAVGGIMHPTVNELLVTKTPYFIMLDSVGQTVYRGESIDSVSLTIKEQLVKMSEKEKAKELEKKKKKDCNKNKDKIKKHTFNKKVK